MAIEVKLPELGDGIEGGDVLEILVKEGDVIEKEQGLVELETDKATVEVPSSHAGTVTKIHVQAGESVPVGATLVSLETAEQESAAPSPASQPPAEEQESKAESSDASDPAPEPAAEEPPPAAPPTRQQETAPAPSPAQKRSPPPTPTPAPTAERDGGEAGGPIPAGPAVRRFAREVGVDLQQVTGSGMRGRITRDDVLAVVRRASQHAAQVAVEPATETDSWGPVRTEKMPKIRKTIAARMYESWSTAPRVTNFDDADVTELERIRNSSKADYAAKGIKLTGMPFLIKACAMALRNHPVLNASLHPDGEHVVYKQYVNIGVAVDTERGLVVPSLRDADKRSIPDIALQVAELAELVRTGKFSIEDLRGSSFTISNLGAIGGTYSTPIINVPEVAILLVGRSRKMPVVVDDEVQIRLMMPLSISYDHRLVDGAAAARFLNDVIGYLKAPSRLLLAP